MNKQLLKEYIKKSVREKMEHQKRIEGNREKSVYLIYKFPGLRKIFDDVMSPAFPRFISSVKIIAPKPTTFVVTLINNLEFNIYYLDKKVFILKIEGKKYFSNNTSELQRASQAITGLLELNYAEDEVANKKAGDESGRAADLKASLSGSSSGGSSDFGGPGIDPNAPADATIPGTESEPGAEPGTEPEPGAEPGAEPGTEPNPEEEEPEEPKP